MKNLQTYGVQELNTQELQTIDGGGILGLLVKGAKYLWKNRKSIGAFFAGEAASQAAESCQ